MSSSSNFWNRLLEDEVLDMLRSLPADSSSNLLAPLFEKLRLGDPSLRDKETSLREVPTLMRLLAVDAGNVRLPDDLQELMKGLKQKYPTCRQEARRRDISERAIEWREPQKGPIVDYASESPETVVERVYSHPGNFTPAGESLNEYLDLFGEDDRERDLEILEGLASLFVTKGPPPTPGNDQDAIAPMYAARRLEKIVKYSNQELTERELRVWDGLTTVCSMEPQGTAPAEKFGYLVSAINHPAGVLTEVLFNLMWKGKILKGDGLPDALSSRLDLLLNSPSEGLSHIRVIVASRLFPLYFAAPEWTKTSVLPLFDWSDEQVAAGSWQGYLQSPRIDESLYRELSGSFLRAFEHIETIGIHIQSLCGLLVTLAITADGVLLLSDARKCTSRLTEEGRGHLAWQLAKYQKAAGTPAAQGQLWRNKTGPFLNEAWPKTRGILADGRAADQLAWAVTNAGDAFSEAVDCVVEMGVKLGCDHSLLVHRLENDSKALWQDSAEDCLRLLDGLLPNSQEIGNAGGGRWADGGRSMAWSRS